LTHYLAAEILNNTLMRQSALAVLKNYSIREPPINVYEILRDQDVQIDFWRFHDWKVEGLYLRNVTGSGVAINIQHPRVKQRFTAAHELKHHLHDVPNDGTQLPPCVSNARSHIERKANAFAAELLMPPAMFQAVLEELGEELQTVTTLAAIFHVSYEATVYRLNTFRYINDGQIPKFLSEGYRREDARAAALIRQNENGRLVNIHLPAIRAAFGCFDGDSYCKKCSTLIINSDWQVCPECGVELI
jgi:Zn-dependent peptidase ImmA (M78 family)